MVFGENGFDPKEVVAQTREEIIPYDADNDMDVSTGPTGVDLGSGDAVKHLNISAVTNAGKQRPNEDSYAVIRDGNTLIAAVFDGVSDRTVHEELEGIAGARYASHSLRNGLLDRANADIGLKELMLSLNSDLASATSKLKLADLERASTLPASTGTIARIDQGENKIEIAHAADTFCILFKKDGSTFMISLDTNLYHMTKDLYEKTPEQNEEATTRSFDEKNNPADGVYGMGILNGSPRFENYLITDDADLTDVEAVLIGSDGLIPPSLSPNNEVDQRRIYEILKAGGVSALLAFNRNELEERKKQGLRTFPDDATGIFIEIKS